MCEPNDIQSFHNNNNPHLLHIPELYSTNFSDMRIKDLYHSVTYFENRLFTAYYKFNSFNLIWDYILESIKGVNLLFNGQEITILFTLVIVALYFILDDYTAFSVTKTSNIKIANIKEQQDEQENKVTEQLACLEDSAISSSSITTPPPLTTNIETSKQDEQDRNTPEVSTTSKKSHMWHRYHNLTYRQKKQLTNDHYFIHFKRFK